MTGNTGYAHNHEFAEFAIVAAGKAFWGLRARATIRTRVVGLHVSGAVNTCIQLEQGFINRVEDCDIQGCSVGLVASNEASSVVLANNVNGDAFSICRAVRLANPKVSLLQNLEGQSLAGIVVGSGSNFLIEGNEIEGIGGPAIVVWGMSNAVAIVGNYFATDDEGFKNSNRDGCPSYFPDCVGNQTYGPLVLQPHCDGGCTGSPPNIRGGVYV